jgi:hypothetical protein
MDRRASLLFGVGLFAAVATVGLVILGPPARMEGVAARAPQDAMASLPPLLSTEDVYAAFAEGGTATSGGEPTVLSAVPAGELMLPTGRVVAADVFFFNTEPFTRRLPAGRHPVLLLSSSRDPGVAGDVAAAMIRVAPGDPVSWELALVPGQDPSSLQPGEFFGYGVDSGTGCFASAEAVAALTAGDFDEYSDQVQDGMFPSDDVADWKHSVDVVVDQASGANVIGFTSGFGDGGYPSWFGLDADGEPLVLLTDFGILEAPGL